MRSPRTPGMTAPVGRRNFKEKGDVWHCWQGRAVVKQRTGELDTERVTPGSVCPAGLSLQLGLENGEVTNPPGFSSAPGPEITDLRRSYRRECGFATLCKGKHEPNSNQWKDTSYNLLRGAEVAWIVAGQMHSQHFFSKRNT